jgi:predicted short-subunit dehydrogenase-like oxidoreductase (DUF2520 family)
LCACPDILAAVERPGVTRPKIAIVGAGRVGTALAVRLTEAGYRITELISRRTPNPSEKVYGLARRLRATASSLGGARLDADVVWFCTPDEQVARTAAELARLVWNRKFAFHASGVLTSDELGVLRSRGAQVASVHPLMTFIPGVVPKLTGVTFAVEADRGAVRVAAAIVRTLGGNVLCIRKQDKAAYHVFATMICPMLVSLLATAEKVGMLAGISAARARTAMWPIIRQTVVNYEKLGPAKAFTGPIMRGDVATVRQHLASLADRPAVERVYLALAQAAWKHLPTRNQVRMNRILDQTSSATSLGRRR